jgi:hypothetical protein
MKLNSYNLSKILCSNIPIKTSKDNFLSDRDRKKEEIKELIKEDMELFDEIMMELRKEKIQKIKNH